MSGAVAPRCFPASIVPTMPINMQMLATGALSFTLAVAWNDAVSKTVADLFPRRTAACAAVISALVLTLVVIAIVAAAQAAGPAGVSGDAGAAGVSRFAPDRGRGPAPRPLVDIRL